MGRYKVLIADDEPSVLMTIKGILEGHQYSVITATSGKESIEKAKKFSPDIIVMDIRMPELDGIATILKLKNFKKTKSIPVIVCTAVKQDEDRILSQHVGIADYFVKTEGLENLAVKIEKVLKQ